MLDEDRALATLAPHTTSVRGSRFEININVRFLREGVFDIQNIITIPHAKLLRKLGSLCYFFGWDLKILILKNEIFTF